MSKLRLILIDDSRLLHRLVVDACRADANMEIVESFDDGLAAIARIAQLKPDVVLVDVEMQFMAGLATVKGLRRQFPQLPIVIFSSATEFGQQLTRDALGLGASDHCPKPGTITAKPGEPTFLEQLQTKLRPFQGPSGTGGRTVTDPPAAAETTGNSRLPRTTPVVTAKPVVEKSALEKPSSEKSTLDKTPTRRPLPVEIVVIASSTGGPNALLEVFRRLPANFPVPIVIAQHMPANFTVSFAKQLDGVTPLTVRQAQEGVAVLPGEVWLAPGDYHLEIHGTRLKPRLHLHQGPMENSVRPAADVLFRSAAEIFQTGVIAVVMTGMGRDGVAGCEVVRNRGGRIFAQDEASSVVWGMPGAVAAAGLAEALVPLTEIADTLVNLTSQRPLATPGPRVATPGPVMTSWMASS